ncbi:MAG: OmpH family outer membrane protein [Vampirovibrio sp.]|nr:OmpH family outer membrane protein [Vampirovibrio sp.]
MKGLKKSAVFFVLLFSFFLSTGASYADNVGYVDIQKVLTNYDRAQSLAADVKVKEAELRKMQADFVKQLEQNRKAQSKNPVGNSSLEKELNDKWTAKVNEFQSWANNKQKELDKSIEVSIQDVARLKGVDVVLSRQTVLLGGIDITTEVLNKLNQ